MRFKNERGDNGDGDGACTIFSESTIDHDCAQLTIFGKIPMFILKRNTADPLASQLKYSPRYGFSFMCGHVVVVVVVILFCY